MILPKISETFKIKADTPPLKFLTSGGVGAESPARIKQSFTFAT